MISEKHGDLLESGCDIIAHQMNLQGIMGGGIALQIAKKFPMVECKCLVYIIMFLSHTNKMDISLGGRVFFSREKDKDKEIVIANCFSQNEDFSTNYKWLKTCVSKLIKFAKEHDKKTIGIPYGYGCGIAKGKWEEVYKIFYKAFHFREDIELQIWKLDKGEKND